MPKHTKRKTHASKVRKHNKTTKQWGGVIPAIEPREMAEGVLLLKQSLNNFGMPEKRHPTAEEIRIQEQNDIAQLQNIYSKANPHAKIEIRKILAESIYNNGKKGDFKYSEDEIEDLNLWPQFAKSKVYKKFVDDLCFPKLDRNKSSLEPTTKGSQSAYDASNDWELVETPAENPSAAGAASASASVFKSHSMHSRRPSIIKKTKYLTKMQPTEFSFPKISKLMKQVEQNQPVATTNALSGVNFESLETYINTLLTPEDKINIINRIKVLQKVARNTYKYNLLSNGKEVIIIAEDPNGNKYNLKTFTKVLLSSDKKGKFCVYNLNENDLLTAYRCSLTQLDEPLINWENIPVAAEQIQTEENLLKNVTISKPMKSEVEQKFSVKHKRHTTWNETTSKCSEYATKDDCEKDPRCLYSETTKTKTNKETGERYDKVTSKCITKKEKLNVQIYPAENEDTDIAPTSV